MKKSGLPFGSKLLLDDLYIGREQPAARTGARGHRPGGEVKFGKVHTTTTIRRSPTGDRQDCSVAGGGRGEIKPSARNRVYRQQAGSFLNIFAERGDKSILMGKEQPTDAEYRQFPR